MPDYVSALTKSVCVSKISDRSQLNTWLTAYTKPYS